MVNPGRFKMKNPAATAQEVVRQICAASLGNRIGYEGDHPEMDLFYNHQRQHSAFGGKPTTLVYWQRNDINQPDQQVLRVALITPDPAQEMGSKSVQRPKHLAVIGAPMNKIIRPDLIAVFWPQPYT